MHYEIIDIQTVTIFLQEDSEGQEITTITVGYAWDDNQTVVKIEKIGRPTDSEVLDEISKKAIELKNRTLAPVGETILKKGTLIL